MKKGLLLICPKPLCQSDAKWEAIDMKIGFYSHANKTLFHERGFCTSPRFESESSGTPKWPIRVPFATGLG